MIRVVQCTASLRFQIKHSLQLRLLLAVASIHGLQAQFYCKLSNSVTRRAVAKPIDVGDDTILKRPGPKPE